MNDEVYKCVLTGAYVNGQPERKTWCGKDPLSFEFVFRDPTHAILNAKNDGRLFCAVIAWTPSLQR